MTISVIIPLYNKTSYIARAINSVLSQTFTDFELIVVDDGSTDGGGDIIRRYADPRVRLIVQENAGVSAARNRGVAEAKSEFVAFLDADDEWMSEFLNRTTEFLTSHPSVGAVFSDIICAASGRRNNPPNTSGTGIVDNYFNMAIQCNGYPVHFSAVVVKRDILLKVGAFRVGVAYGEDIDTFNRLAIQTQIGYISEPLMIYHNEVLGAQAKYREQGYPYPQTVISLRKAGMQCVRADQRRSLRQYISLMLIKYARNQIEVGRRLAAIRVMVGECRPDIVTWRQYLACWKSLFASLCPVKLRNTLKTACAAIRHRRTK